MNIVFLVATVSELEGMVQGQRQLMEKLTAECKTLTQKLEDTTVKHKYLPIFKISIFNFYFYNFLDFNFIDNNFLSTSICVCVLYKSVI